MNLDIPAEPHYLVVHEPMVATPGGREGADARVHGPYLEEEDAIDDANALKTSNPDDNIYYVEIKGWIRNADDQTS